MTAATLPQSTCRSRTPASMWWTENGIAHVFTQWDALVRRFQTQARVLLPATYAPNGFNRSNLVVDGIYGEQTGRALGAALALSGFPAMYARQQTEWPEHRVSIGTTEGLIFYALHASYIGDGRVQCADGFQLTSTFIQVPANIVLPEWGQRPLTAPADRNWFGAAPVGAPAPPAPSQPGHVATPATNGATSGGIVPVVEVTVHDSDADPTLVAQLLAQYAPHTGSNGSAISKPGAHVPRWAMWAGGALLLGAAGYGAWRLTK